MPEVATTLAALLAQGSERLRQAGVADGRREATRIWSELERADATDVVLGSARPVDPGAAVRFETAIGRRAQGEPLAYVTGAIGFRHLTLVADRRALIPRPETEGLVELMLQRVRTGRIVDVGTGTGCIALSLAQEGSFDQIVGVDRSAEALALAAVNRRASGLPVTLVQADLCRPFRTGAFDALISNPPYLTAAEYERLDSSVRDWEPEAALVSGRDGMADTRTILHDARDALRPGGWLAVEVDCSRAAACAAAATALGWLAVSVHVDLFGRERYLLAQRSKTR